MRKTATTDLRNLPQTAVGCLLLQARYRCSTSLKWLLLVLLLGAGAAALPLRPPSLVSSEEASHASAAPVDFSAAAEADLLQQLAAADQQWLPRAETLASGAIRYHYRRRAGEPMLSVAELQTLMANPPSFGAERLAIGELLAVLTAAGVRLEMTQPRKSGAAGEWDPAARTMRIQPRVVSKGSLEFARVLNHEAIHVAQSCRNQGLRSSPRPLGLPTQIPPHLSEILNEPLYRTAPERVRELEREAYANQERLTLGAQLVRRHC